MTNAKPVLVERLDDGVALVTLNRPPAHNAVNGALAAALGSIVAEIEADADIQVAVVTGAGDKAFCVGADLSEMARGSEASLWIQGKGFAGFIEAPRVKVWIAAVNGFALAGGFEIVLSCDLVVASEGAVFGLPEVKRGLIAGAGGLYRLPRSVPRAVAMEMIATGEPIGGERALALGLVNRLVPGDRLHAEAAALARTITANAPVAVRESLAIARKAQEGSAADLLRESNSALDRIRAGEDIREGARAFLEKRQPRWTKR